MTDTPPRRYRGAALVGAIGTGLIAAALSAPAAAVATPAVLPAETAEAQTCSIASSELSWGFKESFRSYISGSIANGEWTTGNGADYETPNFLWSDGEGEVDSTLEEGIIEFTGSINFSGHDGALSMNIENPAIQFASDNSAYLLLDFGATDTAEEGDAESSLLEVAKIDLDGAIDTDGNTITITDGPTRLTSEGAASLNGEYGSYAAGDEMDPINLTATVDGCELGAVAAAPAEPEPEEEATEPIAVAPAESEIPWLPIGIGAAALLVIGVTAGMLVAGRGKGKNNGNSAANHPVE